MILLSTNLEVRESVVQGGRLQQPQQSSEKLWQIAEQCWQNHSLRPDFRTLTKDLEKILSQLHS